MITLVEARKMTDSKVKQDMIETFYRNETLFQWMEIETTDHLIHPYDVEKVLPGIGFRKYNEGFSESTGVVQREFEELKPFGGDSDTDKDIADTHPMVRVRNDRMKVKAASEKFIQTVLYGNSPAGRAGAAFDVVDGFDGIQLRLADAPSTPQVVNAGETTGSTSSSVFVFKWGETNMKALLSSKLIDARDMGELQEKPVYRTRVDALGTIAIYHSRSVAWIKNISPAKPLTVDLMDEAIDLIDGSPSLILMSKRSRRQLKADALGTHVVFGRTLSQAGERFETYDTLPIVVSDAMIDVETAG